MSTITYQPRAEYLIPGTFLNETGVRDLPERTVVAAIAAAPEHAFAFVMHDAPVPDFEYDSALFHVSPIAQNRSAKHYLGGQVFTCDELRTLAAREGDPDKYRTLIANITSWDADGHQTEGRAIRCRTGNWQPFEDGDVLIDVENAR